MVKHLPYAHQQSGTRGQIALLGRLSVLLGLKFLGGSTLDCVNESVNAIAFWLNKQGYVPQLIKLNV